LCVNPVDASRGRGSVDLVWLEDRRKREVERQRKIERKNVDSRSGFMIITGEHDTAEQRR
jgi:hypothetical protein